MRHPNVTPSVSSQRKKRLLDQVRETVRRKHYSLRTEAA